MRTASEGPRHTVEELRAALPMLERHARARKPYSGRSATAAGAARRPALDTAGPGIGPQAHAGLEHHRGGRGGCGDGRGAAGWWRFVSRPPAARTCIRRWFCLGGCSG